MILQEGFQSEERALGILVDVLALEIPNEIVQAFACPMIAAVGESQVVQA